MKRFHVLKTLSLVALLLLGQQTKAQTSETNTGKAPEYAKALDLGLPSGTKWANMNIGANSEEECGLYFAWGETVGYEGVGANQKLNDDHQFKWDFYKWGNGSKPFVTKYCTLPKSGTVDDKTVLEKEDDAATVNWGDSWRMPTKEEAEELIANTTLVEVKEFPNGQKAFYLVSKINGQSILLPVGGMRNYGQHQMLNTFVRYWTSSIDQKHPIAAYSIHSHVIQKPKIEAIGRFMGHNIRAVAR
jgi:hypothetical protein